MDGQFSLRHPVLSFVLQGSVLGPTLFIHLIDYVAYVLSKDTKVLIYADDMKIWKKVENPCDQDDLQMGLDKLFE